MTNTRLLRRTVSAGLPTALCILVMAGCATQAVVETGPTPGTATAGPPEDEPIASFTAVQVSRGQGVFSSICGECHATGDFRGSTFLYEWRRRTAWNFFRTVSETMPEDAPGSLSDQEYVDVVSYVLSLNGYEPGERELLPLRDALELFVMDGAATSPETEHLPR